MKFRDSTAAIADLTSRDATDSFQTQTTTTHLGRAVAVDVTTTPVAFDHSSAHVARSGLDHYMVSMYVAGGCEVSAGRRSITAGAGDIFIVDYSEAHRSRSFGSNNGLARVHNIVLPRRHLAPLLAAPDAVQPSIIRADNVVGTLLGEHLRALNMAKRDLAADDFDQQLTELFHLLARGLGPACGVNDRRHSRSALLSTIKRYIEQHLGDDSLDVTHLCGRFGLSRASLYRLFEPAGGLVEYIHQRRLIRAFALLAAPETRHLRIIDVAVDAHFASDATFNRAFRRNFGVTPGEVRDSAAKRAASEGLTKSEPVSETGEDWVLRLR
jgi:AraC-like DNA-binding protein